MSGDARVMVYHLQKIFKIVFYSYKMLTFLVCKAGTKSLE